MTEQKKICMNKQIFCAGILSFSLIASFFLPHISSAPAAFFFPAIFFSLQLIIGSCLGMVVPLPENLFLRGLFLLIFSVNPDYCSRFFPEETAFHGILCGISVVWAFQSASDKCWLRYLRDYFSGFMIAIPLVALSLLFVSPAYSCLAATLLYIGSSFSGGAKEIFRKRFFYSLLCMIPVTAALLFQIPHEKETPAEHPAFHLRDDLILSFLPVSQENILMVVPGRSSIPDLKKHMTVEVDIIRHGGICDIFSPHEVLSSKENVYDFVIVESHSEYSLITTDFIDRLKPKLRQNGILIYMVAPQYLSSADSVLRKRFKHIKNIEKTQMIVVSDSPLKPVFSEHSMLKTLENYLFTAGRYETVDAEELLPGNKNYRLEYKLSAGEQNIYQQMFNTGLKYLNIHSFLIILAAGIFLFVILRYMTAYCGSAGVKFSLFRDSFSSFAVLSFLLSCRSVAVSDKGVFYAAMIFIFSLGFLCRVFFPEKYGKLFRIGMFLLLPAVYLISFHIGLLWLITCFLIAFSAGAGMKMILRDIDGKFNPEPELYCGFVLIVFSGLFTAILLTVLFFLLI